MADKLTPADLDALEALVAQMTPGPWHDDFDGVPTAHFWMCVDDRVAVCALRNAAPALLAMARRAVEAEPERDGHAEPKRVVTAWEWYGYGCARRGVYGTVAEVLHNPAGSPLCLWWAVAEVGKPYVHGDAATVTDGRTAADAALRAAGWTLRGKDGA
jgi:hypothetical protein